MTSELPILGRGTLPPIQMTYDSEEMIVVTMPPMIHGTYIAGMARHLGELPTVSRTDWAGHPVASLIELHGDFTGRSAHGEVLAAAAEFWDDNHLADFVDAGRAALAEPDATSMTEVEAATVGVLTDLERLIEIERTWDESDCNGAMNADMHWTAKKLRAYIEALHTVTAERDALRAEIDRLNAGMTGWTSVDDDEGGAA